MSNSVITTFANFQKAKVQFVQSLAELSKRKENLEDIIAAGGLLILRPLITDVLPSIAQTACIALGRIATESQEAAEMISSLDIIPQIVFSMADQNRLFKKCSAFLLRSVARHTPALAQSIVDFEGLPALKQSIEDKDSGVREAGCWALSFISKHNAALAGAVCETIGISNLVDCVKEPEISLKRIAINCLTQIAKHNEELAKVVASKDVGLLPQLFPLIKNDDVLLKRQTLACLAQIANGRRELAERIIDSLPLEQLVKLVSDPDLLIRINATELLKNVAKHSHDASRIAVSYHVEKALVGFLRDAPNEGKEGALECLRLMAAVDDLIAYKILQSEADVVALSIIKGKPSDEVKKYCIRLISTLYQYGVDNSRSLGSSDLLAYLMSLVPHKHKLGDSAVDELLKCISNVLKSRKDAKGLEAILKNQALPPNLQYIVSSRIYSILQSDTAERKAFARSKGLETIWELKKKLMGNDQALVGIFDDICSLYPDELVRLYNPDYPAVLLKQLEKN